MTDHFATKELLSLLKVDDKGWNTILFKNEMKISGFICAVCNNICVCPVELGCEHNYVDIYLYCTKCLQQLIIENDGKCPIDKHEDPVIVANRYMERQIANANVFCPYSTEFKCANTKQIAAQNKNEQQILDTLSHHNHDHEGKQQSPIAIYQEQVYGNQQLKIRINIAPESETPSGCDWNGTLHDLIHKHMIGCTQKYNAAFLLNIKIEHLENENQNLKKDLDHYKSHLKQKTIIVADLKKKNAEFEQEIMCLQQQINTDIFKNEVFQNETETGDLITVLMQEKRYEEQHQDDSINKEYLHLTASVVCMKFANITHITTEELIDRVKHYQLWQYHDQMVAVMQREQEKMRTGKKQNHKHNLDVGTGVFSKFKRKKSDDNKSKKAPHK